MAQFRIDAASNSIVPLTPRTFTDLGYKERVNLQEWVANQPSCLGGEELLIIQKEFSGFSDTNERLDLLALDKQGSLVLIENKLDDSGRDVTWQALKYASYCSRLSTDHVCSIYQDFLNRTEPGTNAREKIAEFLNTDYDDVIVNRGVSTQRIILIAAKFRKEVTSTVLWLLNFNLRVQCFQVTPYSMDEQHFLNVEQIIPLHDTEDFMIGLVDKSRDEIENVTEEKNKLRREFWVEVLQALDGKTTRFNNITPGPNGWLGAASGVRGVAFNFAASRNYSRVEIYIDRGDAEENKFIYDKLYAQKAAIEGSFGSDLTWEPLEGKRACRIKVDTAGNLNDRTQWPAMIEFMTNAMVKLENALKAPLSGLNELLRNKPKADIAVAAAPIAEAAEG